MKNYNFLYISMTMYYKGKMFPNNMSGTFYLGIILVWITLLYSVFMFMIHPLLLGLVLIVVTFFLSMYSILYSATTWSGYILFLMFLGGLLILFLYNITLVITEIFALKWGLFFFFVIMMSISFKEGFSEDMAFIDSYKPSFPIAAFFKSENINSMIFLMFYLFITMVCVINMVFMNKNKGTLWPKDLNK